MQSKAFIIACTDGKAFRLNSWVYDDMTWAE